MTVNEYLHFLVNAPSLEELWNAHTRKMAEYGFDRLLYGFTRQRTELSLGHPDDYIILTNHAPEYVEGFLGRGLYFHAPMTHWALENDGAGSWGEIAGRPCRQGFSAEERRVIEFNQQYNVRAGYTISFQTVSTRSKGVISLAARADLSQPEVDDIWAEHGDDIYLMNNVAHLKILSLPNLAPRRVLTKRQREVLEWVGDGKTTQDIARLMGLTAATVEKHLRLARESLAVDTTAQAVMKAALHNQMFTLET